MSSLSKEKLRVRREAHFPKKEKHPEWLALQGELRQASSIRAHYPAFATRQWEVQQDDLTLKLGEERHSWRLGHFREKEMGQPEAHHGQKAPSQPTTWAETSLECLCKAALSARASPGAPGGEWHRQREWHAPCLYSSREETDRDPPSMCLTWSDKAACLHKNRLDKFTPLRPTPGHSVDAGGICEPNKGMSLRSLRIRIKANSLP